MKQPSKTSIQAMLILCTLLGLSQSAPTYADDFNSGWSLDYVVEPSQLSISGMPLGQVDAELTHIEFINCEHQSLSVKQCHQIAEFGGQLEMMLDMNQDGQPELWRIAVAKLRSGEYAKVLVVQDSLSSKVIQTLVVESELPGFSALYFNQGQVMWAMCLSCDVMADIEWHNGAYRVSWQPNLYDVWDEDVVVNNTLVKLDN